MAHIDDYMNYIDLASLSSRQADLTLLGEVVAAHLSKFPYQNTDLFLQGMLKAEDRTPCDISIDALFQQFIVNKRSGYCFQTIELLAWALEELGFKLTHSLAKPINKISSEIDEHTIKTLQFSHEVIIIDLDDEKWLVDTGCGHNSLRKPLKITPGEQELAGDKYQLTLDDNNLRVETSTNYGWFCLYDIDMQPRSLDEIANANLNLFTCEQKIPSRDVVFKLAKVTDTKRKVLYLLEESKSGFFKSYSGDICKKSKDVNSKEQFKALAKSKFGIDVDEGIVNHFFSPS